MYDFRSSPLLRHKSDGERAMTVPFMLVSVLLITFAASFGQELLLMPVMLIAYGGRIMELITDMSRIGDADVLESEMATLMQELTAEISGGTVGLLAQLYSTAVVIALTLVFCLCMERRSPQTMGITRERAVSGYGLGLGIGFVMLALAYLLCVATDALEFGGVSRDVSIGFLVLLLVGYVIQGASEEILLRGFLMLSLSRRYSIGLSVFASSVFFALMHLGNAGVNMLGVFNIFLFGVFISLYTLRSGSLLGACAIHTAWNFTQGHILGCPVSGFVSTESVFLTGISEGSQLTSGGAFGPEGGLAVTLILLLSTVCVCLFPSRTKTDENHENFM